MHNDKLNALSMLSNEKEISNIPNFNEKVIDHFATTRTRKMDFIFK